MSTKIKLFNQYQNIDQTNVYFHWSNSSESIKKFMEQLMNQHECDDLLQIQEIKDHLNTNLIWFDQPNRRPMKKMKLYEEVIKSIATSDQKKFLKEEIKLSDYSSQGPFKIESLISNVDQEELKTLVYYSLINGQLPFRSFRVNFPSAILLKNKEKLFNAYLHEVLLGGLLLKIPKSMLPIIKRLELGAQSHSHLAIHFPLAIQNDIEKVLKNNDTHSISSSPQYTSNFIDVQKNNLKFSEIDMKKLKVSTSILDEKEYFYLYVPFDALDDYELQRQWTQFLCQCVHAFV